MENKYFTPDIEDLHIGYELEYKSYKQGNYKPHKIFDGSSIDVIFKDGTSQNFVRVPYLTKEQIEAEEWEIAFYKDSDRPHFIKKDIECFIHENNVITIISKDYNFLYKGECKDINTFRWICKLIKV